MLLKSASEVWLGGELGLEPFRSNHFELTLLDNNGTKMPDLGQYSIQTVPSFSNPSQIVQYGMFNSFFPVPGMKEHGGNNSLVFRATTETEALKFFTEWRKQVYDPEQDAVGLYADVVGSGSLTPYEPGKGQDCPGAPEASKAKIQLDGVWPVDVLFGEWSMDADGTHATFQVVLAVTDAYITED